MSVAPPSEVFRASLRERGYELSGEIGNHETWCAPSTLRSHVFYISKRDEVTYVGTKKVYRDLSFSEAAKLVGKDEE